MNKLVIGNCFKELFTDFGWLNNFPKWLDVPFMVWINQGWRAFSAKYGLIFDAIGYALLRAYSIVKNLLNCIKRLI